MYVREVMTPDVVVASPEDTLQRAAEMMVDIDAGVLPVGENDRLVAFSLQRRTMEAVVRLNRADVNGVPWFGGAEMHKSLVADVVTYVHPGAHPLPANASDVVVRFFKTR